MLPRDTNTNYDEEANAKGSTMANADIVEDAGKVHLGTCDGGSHDNDARTLLMNACLF